MCHMLQTKSPQTVVLVYDFFFFYKGTEMELTKRGGGWVLSISEDLVK